ncbi:hypothetical protein D3C72_1442690 [compost metagenome]
MKLTSNHKMHVLRSMRALVVLLNISKCNIRDRLKSLTIRIDVFAKLLLDLWPKNTIMIIKVARKLAFYVTLFRFKLFSIKTGFTDSHLLK